MFVPKFFPPAVRVHARSLSNLADASSAMTVAALHVVSPFAQESYSSEGPTNGPGGTLTGGLTKPDISGFANVSTVSYGTTNKFNGTSAATPHVAGAAALVAGANPSWTPSQIQSFLEGRATDMGAAGKDTVFGHGRLNLGAPPTTAVRNRLANPSFERDANRDGRPDSWTTATGKTDPRATLSKTLKQQGTFSIRHFATNNLSYSIGQNVASVPAGSPATFSGWVNIPRTTDRFTFQLRVVWRNASNRTISTSTIKSYTGATRGWVQVRKNLVAPAGTASARVEMVVSNLNATIYADNFVFLR